MVLVKSMRMAMETEIQGQMGMVGIGSRKSPGTGEIPLVIKHNDGDE